MRRDDWAERLASYVEDKRLEPFKWGANDCALFAHGAVCSMIDEHPVSELQLKYRSQKGAMTWLERQEVDDLWAFIDRYFERIPTIMVGRGDLVGHLTTDRSIGVCLGGFFATPSDSGLVFADLSDAEIAWRVK